MTSKTLQVHYAEDPRRPPCRNNLAGVKTLESAVAKLYNDGSCPLSKHGRICIMGSNFARPDGSRPNQELGGHDAQLQSWEGDQLELLGKGNFVHLGVYVHAFGVPQEQALENTEVCVTGCVYP